MRILRRVLVGLAVALGVLLVAGGGWVLFMLFWNPRVPPAAPRVETRAPRSDTVTVVLAGDFAPTDAALARIAREGWRAPYLGTADLLRDADVAFANLEAPVTESHDRFPLYKDYIYRVEPAATEAWRWLGLDVVSLANNHIIDYRERGVRDTVRHLDAAGIAHVGAGAGESEARRPVIFDVGGVTIGFLAYLEDKVAYNLYLRTFAVGGRVGAAKLDLRDLREDVARLRPLVDVLIVSVHWGMNYQDVTGEQERLARALVAAGVDVIAGHHSHDVQRVEVRGRTILLYSLGNWAWGAPGHGELRVGLIARLGIRGGRVATLELLPIATQNRIVDYQPRPVAAEELGWLDDFLARSRAHGTSLQVVNGVVEVQLD